MREKYLPIGTIVLLKGGKKRAMITGFCSVAKDYQDKIFDYSGCVYPEGYLSSNQVCLFDHDQIEKIFYLGYEDEEEKTFKAKLNQVVSQLGEEHTTNNSTNMVPLESEQKKSENIKNTHINPTSTLDGQKSVLSKDSSATKNVRNGVSGFVPFQ